MENINVLKGLRPTRSSPSIARAARRPLLPILAALLGTVAPASVAPAQEWDKDANGTWSDKTNWKPQAVPDGANATAALGKAITAARTVTLDQDAALKGLIIDNANDYTIAGGGGVGIATNRISVTNNNGNGAHTIAAPVSNLLNRPLVISVVNTNAAGLTLTTGPGGNGGLTKDGAGTLVLRRGSSYTGDTSILAGKLLADGFQALPGGTNVAIKAGATLEFGGGFMRSIGTLSGGGNVVLGNLDQLGAASDANSTFSGVISGANARGFIKGGTGTLTLSGMNTYSGPTELNAGTVALGINNALPTSTALLLGGTLDLGGTAAQNGFDQSVRGLSGGGKVVNQDGALRTFTVSDQSNNIDVFSGQILGKVNLVKGGDKTLVLSGANNYSGTTAVTAGTLGLGANEALTAGARLTLQNKAALEMMGFDQTLSTLDGTAMTAIKNSGNVFSRLTVDVAANVTSTFAGEISGDVRLDKKGDGTLKLTGKSTYGAAGQVTTTVGGGTLTVDNQAGSATGPGDVRVTAGKLDGSGTIGGKVFADNAGMVGNKLTINGGVETNGGKVGVGTAPGKLTVATGFDMSAGGTYAWQLGALSEANPGTDFSLVSLTSGMLSLGANATIGLEFLNNTTPAAGVDFWTKAHTWDVIDVANKDQNPNGSLFGMLGNATFDVGSFTTAVGDGANAGDVLLKFTPKATPEPSSLVLACLGASTLLAYARRASGGRRR